MGVTIHYRGELKEKSLVYDLIEEVSEIADTMGWKYSIMDEDWSIPSAIKVSSRDENGLQITGHAGLKGISFLPHPKSENVQLYFDNTGKLNNIVSMAFAAQEDKTQTVENTWLWVKTQYAGIDTHITIVNLLKYLKKRYFDIFEVNDEGEYWERADKAILERKMNFIDNALSFFKDAFDNSEPINSIEDIIDKLGRVLEQLARKKDKKNEEDV